MHISKKTKLQILGMAVIIIGIMIGIIPSFLNNNESNKEKNKIDDYIKNTSVIDEKNRKENDNSIEKDNRIEIVPERQIEVSINEEESYLLILEIPKINFKRGVYSLNSRLNTIDKNVQIMKESNLPNVENGNLVLEAHNGTASISYFRELHKLNNGDIANIYFNGVKYTYVVYDIYDVSKDGTVEVYRDKNKTTLTLVTCKRNTNDRQLVIILYLESKEEY